MKKAVMKMKRYLAVTVIFCMLFPMLPWSGLLVHAEVGDYDPANYRVDSISIGKTYDQDGNLTNMYIDIVGVNLRNAAVRINTYEAGQRLLTPYRTVNEGDFLKFEVSGSQIQDEASFLGQSITIGNYTATINENQIPSITDVTRKVKASSAEADGTLTITGTRFNNIGSNNITAQYGRPGSYQDFPGGPYDPDKAEFNNLTGALGMQNIVFIKSNNESHDFPGFGASPVNTSIVHTYTSQFRLYQAMDLSGIEMTPNRGEKGDTVYFKRDILNNYDVYFMREIDGTVAYSIANRGTDKTFAPDAEDGKDILTVRVPDLPVGEYYVVLTNPVIGDPALNVNQEYILKDKEGNFQKFTIIDANIKSKIISVQPNSGPDTGTVVNITGQFFGSLNIPEFVPGNNNITVVTDPESANPQQLEISYTNGTYRGQAAEASRIITVYIGGNTVYQTRKNSQDETEFDYSFSSNLDRLTVRTPQITDADVNPVKDVIVETVTTITTSSGTVTVRERAELKDGFTYIPSKIEPVINSVTPDKIQVTGTPGDYQIPSDRLVAVHGENFMIHRYVKPDGTEVVRYPVIEFGSEIVIDKNTTPEQYVKVLDAAGRELDGTTGSELGTKILVMLPQGTSVENLGKTFIRVTNPTRNTEEMGLSTLQPDFIEFVNPEANKNPIITSVRPDTVAVDGGEEIVIEGSNFLNGVKVFIDGQEVTPITRQEDGRRITFKAPPGREGETQIQVMNPEGGMDTRPFTYVITFTNPRIIDFSPKSGNTNTLVIIKGENFLKPDPTATAESIYRLIGTRVMLGDQEINEYNLDPITKRITLRDYTSPADDPIFSIENGGLRWADYYSGVILETEDLPHRFYTIDVNGRGEVILSDGASNSYTIRLNEAKDAIMADKEGGNLHPLTIEQDHLIIEPADATDSPIRLNMKTLYKVEGNQIVGNRVRVNDRNEIYFRVPVLGADGYYDLTVINPDTKKDSRVNQQGFYYYTQPQSRPQITAVDPNEGSVNGGYTIDIIGVEFEDNGTTKSKVYVNGVEVPAADTVVSVDGRKITVRVPAYDGDLMQDRGTNRLTVPIVVVNPDGGTASEEKAFTYVIPSSSPRITRIVPVEGTAAGGEIVEITGTDFRFYEPYDDANRNQIKDPDESFNDLNNNGIWDDLERIERLPGESDENYQARVDELLGKTELNHRQYDYYYNSPVLPKVFFGDQQAKIVEFSRGYLKVITPPGASGQAQVYVLNNDAGLSNKVTYTYRSSNPAITRIIPNQGSKLGGDRIEIIGTGFAYSEMEIYLDREINGSTDFERVNQPRIRFGNITNRNLQREQENSGRIDNNRASVSLAGNLRLEYVGNRQEIHVQIEENGKLYQATIKGYDNSIKYIPVSMLKTADNEAYQGTELIRVEVSDRRFIVERGYAVTAQLVNPTQIMLRTPSYYTVGVVPVFVINPDGGQAQDSFEYKNPDSEPVITNITKEGLDPVQEEINGETVRILRMTHKGGNVISVIGQDFREGAIIQISNIATIDTSEIDYQLPNRLTFEMPDVGEGAMGRLHRVVVTNTDGGAAYSDESNPPIYIEFIKGETQPQVTAVKPDHGPASGGTRVVIEGADFRESLTGFEGNQLQVFFGEARVDQDDIEVVDYRTIHVIVPKSNKHGLVDVKVENPDGELAILRGGFTYISQPKITNVNPSKILANDTDTEVTIKGEMFISGAKVIIGGKIINERDLTDDMDLKGKGIHGVDDYGDNIHVAVVGGKEAASVTVADQYTIKVKFNEALDLENTHLIIINPDGGISEPYDRFDYAIPVPNKPMVLEGIPGAESSINLIWSDSDKNLLNAADRFEIYGRRINDREYTYIGDTRSYEYVVKNLEPNTQYRLMVRAMNQYGSATDYAEVTVRTFSEREDQQLKDKLDAMDRADEKVRKEGKVEYQNNTVIRTIGTQEVPVAVAPYVIDFSLSQYKNQNRYVVAIPLTVAENLNRKIVITDGTIEFTFLARDLYTREAIQVPQANRNDAHIHVIIERLSGPSAESVRTALSRTQIRASEVYDIDFQLQSGTSTQALGSMLRNGEIRFKYDSMAYASAKGRQLFIGQYDYAKHGFNKVADGQQMFITRKGRFMLMAQR